MSRLQLSVNQLSCCPCFSRKRVLATFKFKDNAWRRTKSSYYANVATYKMTDTKKLRRMQPDIPLKAKIWVKRRPCKKVLQTTLGDLLEGLESHPATLTLELTSSSVDVMLNWSGGLLRETGSPTPEPCLDDVMDSADEESIHVIDSADEASTDVIDSVDEESIDVMDSADEASTDVMDEACSKDSVQTNLVNTQECNSDSPKASDIAKEKMTEIRS